MAKQIYMIRMGQTMQEGTIVNWLKHEGEFVQKGDELYEMEYDKATSTCEAKNSGYLHIIAEEGDTVPVSTVVGLLLEEGETLDGNQTKAEVAAPAPKTEVVEVHKAAEVVNSINSDKAPLATPFAKKLARDNDIDLRQVEVDSNGLIRKAQVEAYISEHAKPLATPFAKKLARENHIDLSSLNVAGRIYSKDVYAAIEAAEMHAENDVQVASKPVALDEPRNTVKEESKPMSALRRTIASRMTQSYFSSPVVSFMREADTTKLNAFYQEARAELKKTGLRITITDLLIRACAKALRNKPYVNVSIDGQNIVYKQQVNIGLAVAVEGGLLVPVIKNADQLSMAEIARERMRMVEGARNRTLSGDDMTGGTFTISNLGAMGIEYFTPILNQPETAIIGIGRSEDKVVVENGEMVIRNRMSMSLTADHRVIDGAAAAEFMEEIAQQLQNPFALVF